MSPADFQPCDYLDTLTIYRDVRKVKAAAHWFPDAPIGKSHNVKTSRTRQPSLIRLAALLVLPLAWTLLGASSAIASPETHAAQARSWNKTPCGKGWTHARTKVIRHHHKKLGTVRIYYKITPAYFDGITFCTAIGATKFARRGVVGVKMHSYASDGSLFSSSYDTNIGKHKVLRSQDWQAPTGVHGSRCRVNFKWESPGPAHKKTVVKFTLH